MEFIGVLKIPWGLLLIVDWFFCLDAKRDAYIITPSPDCFALELECLSYQVCCLCRLSVSQSVSQSVNHVVFFAILFLCWKPSKSWVRWHEVSAPYIVETSRIHPSFKRRTVPIQGKTVRYKSLFTVHHDFFVVRFSCRTSMQTILLSSAPALLRTFYHYLPST